MWNKMCKTGWLDGITVHIKGALCSCRCEKCGCIKEIWIEPFDWNARRNCDCARWKGFHIEKIIKAETDIPQSDIDIAYRAANGKQILSSEWD
jgi:protein subunit release factor B